MFLIFFLSFTLCSISIECSFHEDERPSNVVRFCLYTRTNRDNCYQLSLNNINNIDRTPYNNEKRTVMFIHDSNEETDNNVSQHLKDAYVNYGNFNVILLNRKSEESEDNYSYRVNLNPSLPYNDNARKQITEFINALLARNLLNLNRFHIVGNNLASQVAEAIGSRFVNGYDNNKSYNPLLSTNANLNNYLRLLYALSSNRPAFSRYNLPDENEPGCADNDVLCKLVQSYLNRRNEDREEESEPNHQPVQKSSHNGNPTNGETDEGPNNNNNNHQSSSLPPTYFTPLGPTVTSIADLFKYLQGKQWPFAIYLKNSNSL